MPSFLLTRYVLLLPLVASVAVAQEREPQIRNVTLPDEPIDIARPVYVAGEVATILRFEMAVDPTQTKLVGWEGRFEPLGVTGRSVVLVPRYDLTPADRLPLVVTLVDGTQVPFTVQAAEKGRVDHQVNLFRDRESEEYQRAALENALWRERFLLDENERYRREETSEDHALAALLASGSSNQTRFRSMRTYIFKEFDSEVVATAYSGKGKAAVIVRVKNHGDRSWNMSEARLTSADEFYMPSPKTRRCAVRMTPRSIAPGASGAVAIVVDRNAFVSDKGIEALALQIIRDDGRVQALVMLEPALARE